ncbi:MAG TPA: hypothetical protein VMI52_09065 [Acetobacteraceae bacterium]|nr:hypothetical protein [Acetobacteraceae bacterium]
MRTLRLARVAAQAEGVRLRRLVRQAVIRVLFAVIAAIFATSALALLHALAWTALVQYARLSPFVAAAIVFGADVACAMLFGLLAAGKRRDPVEREARDVRDQSIRALRAEISGMLMLRLLTLIAVQAWRMRKRA